MFKNFSKTVVFLFVTFILSSFSDSKPEKFIATFEIEGVDGTIQLESDAVYGSYDSYGKIFHYFGKLHMFTGNEKHAKIFNDLCITNNAKQFQITVEGADKNRSISTYAASFDFKKTNKLRVSNELKSVGKGIHKKFSFTGSLKAFGFTLTPEAEVVFGDKFTFTINSL